MEVRNLRILRTIPILILICLFSFPAQAKYGGGTGEPNDPYQIGTAEGLMLLGESPEDYDKHFILIADIDLDPNLPGRKVFDRAVIAAATVNRYPPSYRPVVEGMPFVGVFDGDGHTISHLTVAGDDCLGLFGCLERGAEVKDLGVVSVNIAGKDYIGGLVGYNGGSITSCYSTGAVIGNRGVGGLVGSNRGSGSITNCYSTGAVTGNTQVGGLIGQNHGDVSQCYSTGTASGERLVGGLVGDLGPSAYQCFWDIQTCGLSTSAAGVGRTTAQMQSRDTFSCWAGDGIWTLDEGKDYPRLWWENAPGEPMIRVYSYGGGTGVAEDPYLIYTADQLDMLGILECDWDKHFKLMADIDLAPYTGADFNFIGIHEFNPFTGVFDGNGHTISNFNYSTTDYSYSMTDWYAGLFKYVERGTIKNLGLINPVVATTGSNTGSLVGCLEEGTISNCYVDGASVSGDSWIGGLVGICSSGMITNCYSTGMVNGGGGLVGRNDGGIITNCYSVVGVTGTTDVGGLVGVNDHGTVTNCYSSGDVSGAENVGGLSGSSEGTIANCYSTGSVSGQGGVGGLVGSNSDTITNCYSLGSVTGTTYVGGLVGLNDSDTVTDCFWDTQTSGQVTSACGVGLTTVEMQTESTFVVWGGDRVWTIDEGVDYPRLLWENKPGKLITKPPPPYWEGSGTEDDPFLIYTAEQLSNIGLARGELGKHFKLMADIDLAPYTGQDFNIIGSQAFPFSGVFDGNGKKILNFNYIVVADNTGLFGYVSGANAQIKDLGLIDPNVGGEEPVGSLVGWLHNGIVTNCHVEKADVSGDFKVGGLVGHNSGTIINCTASARVGGRRVGCLVGYNAGGISECCSSGKASGHWYPAGLVGVNSGVIFKCYSSSDVAGDHCIGGLVALNDGGIISNCYSTGSVSRRGGGFVAINSGVVSNCYSAGGVSEYGPVAAGLVRENSGTVTASFWDIETSGLLTSDGGIGKTTAEMQTARIFIEAGWDFTNIWNIGENQTYPFLRHRPPGDLNYDYRVDLLDLAILAEHWLEGLE
ncbi:MAG: GLUG motif-containing protein [Planctomycetota bacterium]|jgi:hypothetical protein